MMGSEPCRYPGCENPRSGHGATFCSTAHELQFEHIHPDVWERRLSEEERTFERDRRPCR